ncbi:MAG: dTDP-glucose 4,6-dehydratase [Candidatus Cloacimonetes bacterium]|nr:dTDP-glucose 4,6-dehydratase [Candidatus Cloacimonadota bacterium]
MKTILVTGGAGFIGSNFIRYILDNTEYRIINFDCLTYAGNLENLRNVENNQRYEFLRGDITCLDDIAMLRSLDFTSVINFAAESHVDRSILEPNQFILTNVVGTQNLLNLAINKGVEKYIQVSTDEVYGSLGAEGLFTEQTSLDPTSPYSSSKAASDLISLAYFKTFELPVNITRCSNNYGPYQFPEKLIPLMINNARQDKALPVYGDGRNIRDWIYVDDHCSGILKVLEKGVPGNVYNLGGSAEKQNIEIVKLILELMNKPDSLISYVKDRKAHDRRYAIDYSKIENELGWRPLTNFRQGMIKTVNWYLENTEWLNSIISGDYQNYYNFMYGD